MATPPVLSRRAHLLCFCAIVAGAVLRFWMISKDIPFGVGIDEPAILDRAVQMVKTGSLNPRGFYDYGTLSMYLNVVVVVVRFLAGAMGGLWSSLQQTSLGDYFLWARATAAALGVGTIVLVYRIAARWGERPAVIAALVMAVQPWHVLSSHFVLTDVPLTFMVAASMVASLRAAESRALGWLAVAAMFAGLAAAAKYNGAVVLLIPLTVAAMWAGQRGIALLITILACGAGFLIGAPFTVLDLPVFLNAFGELTKHFSQTHSDAFSVYLKHLRMALSFGGPEWVNAAHQVTWKAVVSALTGWLLLCATCAGLLIALWRAIGRPMLTPALGFLAFLIVYVRLLTNQSGQIYARYELPLVPLVALGLALAASGAGDVVGRLFRSARARAMASAAVLAVAVLPALYQSLAWDREWSKVSATRLAHDWMLGHVRASESVVVEDYVLRPETPRFTVDHVEKLIDKSLDQYRAEGVTYLVATSIEYEKFTKYPDARPTQNAAYQTIFREAEEVARFDAGPENSPGSSFRIFRIAR